MANKKISFFNTLFFLFPLPIGPLLIIETIRKKRKITIGVISFFIGLFSFSYVPSFTNDKYYYFELYQDFQIYGLKYYLSYLEYRPDVIFYSLIYTFTVLGLNFKFFCGLLGGFMFYFISWSIGLNSVEDRKKFMFILFLLITGISFPDYFSGLRFYFALTLFLIGIRLFITKRIFFSFFFILISFFTHFSILAFAWVPIILVLKPRIELLNILYAFSLLFLFLPVNEVITEFLIALNLDFAFVEKSLGYLQNEDHFLEGLSQGNIFNKVQFYYRMAIVVVVNLSFFVVRKTNSQYLPIYILQLTLTNLLFTIPVVYLRYSIFTFYLLTAVLISTNIRNFYQRGYLIYFAFYFILFFLVFRENVFATLMQICFFFTPSILFSSPSINYLI